MGEHVVSIICQRAVNCYKAVLTLAHVQTQQVSVPDDLPIDRILLGSLLACVGVPIFKNQTQCPCFISRSCHVLVHRCC